MIIMGLDQSFRSSGIVIFENNKMIHCETMVTDTTWTDKFYRAYKISKHIRDVCKKWEVTHILMEGLAFGARGDVTRDLGGLFYTIIIECGIRGGLPITVIAPTQLKKYATGNGRSKKEVMIERLPHTVYEKFIELGFKKTTGLADLADAFFLGRMASELDENQG